MENVVLAYHEIQFILPASGLAMTNNSQHLSTGYALLPHLILQQWLLHELGIDDQEMMILHET